MASMDVKKVLANNLRRMRKDLDLSQNAVAEGINMHPTKYSEIERGMRWPRETTLVSIAEFFEVETSELLLDDSLVLKRAKEALDSSLK